MADNSWRVSKSLSINPQSSVPTNPVNGDVYYDSVKASFVFYDNGSWINLASQTDVASATTLDSVQFTAVVVQNPLVRITGSTASNLYGLTASTGGKSLIIYNASSAVVAINSNSVTEPTAANRILTPGNAVLDLGPGQGVTLTYDNVQSRWVVSSSSGSAATGGIAQEVALAVATTSVNVTYPVSLPSTSYGLICQLVNFADTEPQFQTLLLTNKTTTGFTAEWNYPLNSSNYFLDYLVAPGLTEQTIGETNISMGSTSATIAFPSLFSTSYVVVAEMANYTDSTPQFQTVVITGKMANQFVVSWNYPLDTANYRISWQISVFET